MTSNSPYDRCVKADKQALTNQQRRGMDTLAASGCTSYRSGPAFNGPAMSPGCGFFMKFPTFPGSEYDKKYQLTADAGRFDVTDNEADKNVWKVPPLRNIAMTAPYFHNGEVKTLGEVVRVLARMQLNMEISDDLTAHVVAFLNALTGEFPQQPLPQLPPTPGRTVID